MACGVPVALALGAGAAVFFLGSDGLPAEAFVQKVQSSFGSFPLLAIPLFVLAASILNAAGVTQRLFALAEILVGRSTGGLGKINVLMATLMGGISASASADAAMQAKLIGVPMIERGYPRPFVAAIIACSAVITPIIPPGIGFILYGAMTETSIGRLFTAGILPGLLLCLALIVIVHVEATRLERSGGVAPLRAPRRTPGAVLRALRRASLALLMPLFIIVGIRFGLFTATEAGAVMVVIGLAFGFLIYRELSWPALARSIGETVEATASLMLIVCFSTAFAFYLTWEGIPQATARFIVAQSTDPIVIIILINVALLVAGMFLDMVSAMIILVPIIHPIALRVGIDPVHMGLMVVLNLTMGAVTPPVGTLMYLVNGVLGTSVVAFTRAAAPFFLGMLVVLALVAFVPALSLLLPNVLF
ncbi:MAG: TRAP transporter large permease [Alphaproteobacteria bacterium]|nr:TRAP transporter large permease [Alphaproteobacteria bacterium]